MKSPPAKRKTSYSSLRRIARGLGLPLTVGAAKAIETRSAKTEGLGPKDESAARQGLPETSLGGSNDRS